MSLNQRDTRVLNSYSGFEGHQNRTCSLQTVSVTSYISGGWISVAVPATVCVARGQLAYTGYIGSCYITIVSLYGLHG